MSDHDPNADLWGGGQPSGRLDRDFVELILKAAEAGNRLLDVLPHSDPAHSKKRADVLWLHDRATTMIRREVARRLARAQDRPQFGDEPAPRFDSRGSNEDVSVDEDDDDLG